jgi:hypothetical protein
MRSLLVALTAAVTALAVPAAATTVRESFEQNLGGWQADTDGRARAWQIYPTTDRAVDGTHALGLFLNGMNDDGTIWIERPFAARPGATVPVTVSFWLYSEGGGDVNAWSVVGYAGTRDPETTADIRSVVGSLTKKGWTQFTFTRKVTTDAGGTVWVAVGLWANYEVVRTSYLDLVETTIG